MTKISLIVAMARNHVIGKNNDLPWHIPADLKRFKTLTTGKPVIMGRKTFESIVARIKKPLPDRPNIVISKSGFSYDGVDVFTDLDLSLKAAQDSYPSQEIMIIGGASVYEQALPHVNRMYLTVIDQDIDGDAWFPKFNWDEWHVVEEEQVSEPVIYKNYIIDRK